MRIYSIICLSLLTLTALCFLGYFLYEICCSIRRKKTKVDDFDFDDFNEPKDDEPYIPELSGDAIQKLKPGREAWFVEQEIFPAVPRVLSFMTIVERYWAGIVLGALIGILVDRAPRDEQDFATVLEMLENAQIPEDADEDWQPSTDLFMKEYWETRSSKAYNSFRKYCTSQQTVIVLCTQIIQTICVKLYGFVPMYVSSLPHRFSMKGTVENDTDR